MLCTNIFFSSQDIADPVLLHKFVQRQDSIHGTCQALFLQEDGSHPTFSWSEMKLFSFVNRSFSGHSSRAGGATFYASLSLSKSVIMALGCRTSAAWRIYICDNPCVCATHRPMSSSLITTLFPSASGIIFTPPPPLLSLIQPL
jgi:hypothetical protein